jgi:ADP-ribose 1''-phosphate phosphatase
MLKLYFKKGDLLKNMNTKDVFVHACNSKGSWGAGIALQFKMQFPEAYKQYNSYCFQKDTQVGDAFIAHERGYKIGCLLTSSGYGKFTDPPKKIIVNTYYAVKDLLDQIEGEDIYIHSNVFNSGLFNVHWNFTQKVLEKIGFETERNIYWTVWDL